MKSQVTRLGLLLLATGLLTWAAGCTATINRPQPARTSAENASMTAMPATKEAPPEEIPLLQVWSGDYPVTELNRLPAGQRRLPAGYIGDAATFAYLWQAFKPEDPLPAIDFGRNLVVFTRNTTFYNRTRIFKVTLRDGVAEVLAMETMSALPIEDRVAMSLAVIPRAGIRYFAVGEERIAVNGN